MPRGLRPGGKLIELEGKKRYAYLVPGSDPEKWLIVGGADVTELVKSRYGNFEHPIPQQPEVGKPRGPGGKGRVPGGKTVILDGKRRYAFPKGEPDQERWFVGDRDVTDLVQKGPGVPKSQEGEKPVAPMTAEALEKMRLEALEEKKNLGSGSPGVEKPVAPLSPEVLERMRLEAMALELEERKVKLLELLEQHYTDIKELLMIVGNQVPKLLANFDCMGQKLHDLAIQEERRRDQRRGHPQVKGERTMVVEQ